MRLLATASIATLAFVGTASSAAEQICERRDIIVASLTEKYGEAVQSIGLDKSGNLLEIFASVEGSWTALLTSPRGQACVVAAGEAFEQVSLPPAI
jgi:hypothetical protein